jgi:hypothetical protein
MNSMRPISLIARCDTDLLLFSTSRSISSPCDWWTVGSPLAKWNLGYDGQVDRIVLLKSPLHLYYLSEAIFLIVLIAYSSNTVIFRSFFVVSSDCVDFWLILSKVLEATDAWLTTDWLASLDGTNGFKLCASIRSLVANSLKSKAMRFYMHLK